MKKKALAAFLAAMMVLAAGCGAPAEKGTLPGGEPPIENNEDAEKDEIQADDQDKNDTDGAGDADKETAAKPGGGSSTAAKPGAGSGSAAGKPDAGAVKPGGNNGTSLQGSIEDIIAKIYAGVPDFGVNCSLTEVNGENSTYYLGTDSIDFVRAVASEPMMSSIAHSVVLVETKEGADISTVKKKIKENVDGRKWVCVGVEPENILVENVGNYVLLVMDEDAGTFMKQFKNLAK